MKDGEHVKDEDIRKRNGTLSYSSINSMEWRSLSRKDDLESLAYNLVELLTGELPWDKILENNEASMDEKYKLLIEFKNKPAEEICKGTCEEFEVFLREVRGLKFDQKPKYDKYYMMFEKLLDKKENDG